MYGISLTATDVASAVARSSSDSATQQIRIREGIERQVNRRQEQRACLPVGGRDVLVLALEW
jgi:hypothetical protein